MRKSPRKSVTSTEAERALVTLVVDFANQGPPGTPGAVEHHFQQHPFVQRSPYWKSIDPVALKQPDPDGQISAAMARDFGGVQLDLRRRLEGIMEARGVSSTERAKVERNLQELLTVVAGTPAGPIRVPLGTIAIGYQRGQLTLGFQPFLTGVQATIDYGLALLLDAQRELSRGLMQCQVSKAGVVCGRFFWRSFGTERYCSTAHQNLARRKATMRRQQKWRATHLGWTAGK